MIKHSAKLSAASTDLSSTDGPKASEATAAIQFAYNGAGVPPAHDGASTIADPSTHKTHDTHDTVQTADHAEHFTSHTDVLVAGSDVANNSADVFSNNSDHIVGSADLLVTGETANTAIAIRSIEPQHSLGSSAAEFADLTGSIKSPAADANSSLNGGFNEDRLASLFDHLDQLTQNLNSPGAGEVFNAPAEHVFNVPEPYLLDVPEVISDAKGHGGGGPGGGGGGTPASYTTNSGTGVNIHITYDNSVGSAPSGFTSDVQQVADFFAKSFTDPTAITMNIAVGFGEIDGMRLGLGALGESATNLAQVSYSTLQSDYSNAGLVTLGGQNPTGSNLYVSFAEGKALGLIGSSTAIDGWVGFSSKSGIFDYNNTDGVSSNQYDFAGAVAHELSEVMGRILLVGGSINNAPSYVAYDLFHYASPGVQDFQGNGGYFSTNQGTTNLANFNNASNGGDAGDWLSSGGSAGTVNSGGSVFDAFNAFGNTGVTTPVTHTDLLALQAILNLQLA
jgi:hypothetical protein